MVYSLRDSANTSSFGLVDVDTVRENRVWFFALGIIFVALGTLAILLPFIASLVTTVVLGWLMVIGGFFQGFHALQNRRWANSAWAFLGALIQVIAGVLVLAFPVTGTLTLTLILAVFFLAQGGLNIIRAIQHRKMPFWGWLLFDGLVALALGVLILMRWPSTAAWALGLLVGIYLLVNGSSMLLIGFSARPVARAPASSP